MLIFSLVLCHYYYTSTLCSASDLNNLFLYNAHNYFQMLRKSKNYATAPEKYMTNVMKWRTANCEFKAPKESQSKKSLHVSQKNNINLSCPML